MEPIHATPHYNVLQPPDGSFVIVGRTKKARQVLRDILAELEFDTDADPIREDGSYPIRRDNPFGLVDLVERCDARMTLADIKRVQAAGQPPAPVPHAATGTQTPSRKGRPCLPTRRA